MARKTDTLHENLHIFMTISCLILLRMRNVSDKSYREIQNTHFTLNYVFPRRVPFMRLRRKQVESDMLQMTV